MTVYVLTHEPYHDNSCLMGVYDNLGSAKLGVAQPVEDWTDKPDVFDVKEHSCYFNPDWAWQAESVLEVEEDYSSNLYMIRAREVQP